MLCSFATACWLPTESQDILVGTAHAPETSRQQSLPEFGIQRSVFALLLGFKNGRGLTDSNALQPSCMIRGSFVMDSPWQRNNWSLEANLHKRHSCSSAAKSNTSKHGCGLSRGYRCMPTKRTELCVHASSSQADSDVIKLNSGMR